MIKYRVSKFNTNFINNNRNFIENTWTSYSDIGNLYKGNVFTLNEYLDVENKYIKVILDICNYFNTKVMHIRKIESYFSVNELKKMLNKKGISLSVTEINILNSLVENKELKVCDMPFYIRLILRECFWGELYNDDVLIEFGYDFYMYVTCSIIPSDFIAKFANRGIFIEKY